MGKLPHLHVLISLDVVVQFFLADGHANDMHASRVLLLIQLRMMIAGLCRLKEASCPLHLYATHGHISLRLPRM